MESLNGKLRDELLNKETFDTLLEAKVLFMQWRHEYNTILPHSALGYRFRRWRCGSPVRSLRLRFSKRMGLVCRRTKT